MDKPYIIIAGPTAAGKTRTAAELALIIGGEVISADSMQIYKFMDIGTAKPSTEETLGVKHHLIDELYPDEEYSAYLFQKKAAAYAAEIRARGKYPIICGGTGFYINALINGNDFTEAEIDTAYRAGLYALAGQYGANAVYKMLETADPASAAAIHPNNVKRVIRALEYNRQTGGSIALHSTAERKKRPDNAKIALLSMDRGLLYKRINKRADDMICAGLENEVRGLLEKGYHTSLTSMHGLGYKEMARYIAGECTLADSAEDIKTGTRRYAKRQLTWFSRQCEGIWYDSAGYSTPKSLAKKIATDLCGKL